MTVAPIDCRSAMRELWEYLDDELPADRTAQIRDHLSTCDGCRQHVDFCRAFLMQIDTAPVSHTELSSLQTRVTNALAREGLAAQR